MSGRNPWRGGRRGRDRALVAGLLAGYGVAAVRHFREPALARGGTGLSTPRRAYLGLLGLTLLNPATIVYFGALVLGRQASSETPGLQVIWVVGAFVASASWQLLIAGGGRLAGRVLTGPRGRLGTALGSSLVIVVLAVGLVVGS